mmetsp:Transcript_57594/g.134982  ORF Transcript_57594/g.134982 Transcript_57594/m.134982 type:complete len:133 (-) Transcript_57594:83-481(-)
MGFAAQEALHSATNTCQLALLPRASAVGIFLKLSCCLLQDNPIPKRLAAQILEAASVWSLAGTHRYVPFRIRLSMTCIGIQGHIQRFVRLFRLALNRSSHLVPLARQLPPLENCFSSAKTGCGHRNPRYASG